MSHDERRYKMIVNSSVELALFLEKMRFMRGISQEEFTVNIISNRQYQRYIKGDSPMPFHLLDAFAERLGVKKDLLLLEFDSNALKETFNIINYFSAVNGNEVDKINHYRSIITPEYIINPDNRNFYHYTTFLLDFKSKKISAQTFKTNVSKLINYPKTLQNTVMTYFEVIILSNLLDFVEVDEQLQIVKKLTDFFDNPDLVWSGNQLITYNIVIFRLAKYFGIKEDHENVIKYCKLGIKLNHRAKSYNNLEFYYYFLSLSYYRQNKILLYEESLYKCFNVLSFEDSSTKLTQFESWINKDFNIDFKQFIIDYLKRKPGI